MSEGDRFFVDTNVLPYSMDTSAPKKREPALQLVEEFTRWQPVEMTPGQIRRGWHWIDRAQLSYWDGLIVAAAERMQCAWLLSEDFQAGQRFGAVTIVNPFLVKPVEFGLE